MRAKCIDFSERARARTNSQGYKLQRSNFCIGPLAARDSGSALGVSERHNVRVSDFETPPRARAIERFELRGRRLLYVGAGLPIRYRKVVCASTSLPAGSKSVAGETTRLYSPISSLVAAVTLESNSAKGFQGAVKDTTVGESINEKK